MITRQSGVMPIMKKGRVRESELPAPVKRSDAKAKRTFAKAHDSAAEEYKSGERARRVAFAALKRTHEKVGDHWEPKKKSGPSDARAEKGGLKNPRKSAGGVDANASKEHLLGVAKRLEIKGRSKMKKKELVEAIQKANTRKTAKARAKK